MVCEEQLTVLLLEMVGGVATLHSWELMYLIYGKIIIQIQQTSIDSDLRIKYFIFIKKM